MTVNDPNLSISVFANFSSLNILLAKLLYIYVN